MAENMVGSRNFASVFSTKVDERFTRESQAMMALNNDYQFKGVKTVEVYSVPVVPMNDYTRSGENRYGTPKDLGTEVQSLTIEKDRSWTFVIDKMDRNQQMMVLEAGKAAARQVSEVIIPEFDTYVFKTLAKAATDNGNTAATTVTKTNAYEQFLAAQEALGNKNVPEKGRIAFCSYKFANLLKQDSSFMKYGNLSQEMVNKGILGECDGIKIVKVPASRLPAGCDFIMTHPVAATAPKQLQEYKIHSDPPGISGWLAEGRFVYDCFVLNNKADAVYYHGTAVTE